MAKFEESLNALETVVERLERGDLSLEDSVKLFEDGMKLSAACKAELDAAEGRVQMLTEQSNGRMAATELDVPEDPARVGRVEA
jgi:exodeoxyribonuclease VII small subunit